MKAPSLVLRRDFGTKCPEVGTLSRKVAGQRATVSKSEMGGEAILTAARLPLINEKLSSSILFPDLEHFLNKWAGKPFRTFPPFITTAKTGPADFAHLYAVHLDR